MKTIGRLFLFLLLGAPAIWAFPPTTEDATKPTPRIRVIFSDPEKFTDVKDSYMGTDKGRDAILAQLKDYIRQRASLYLADGQKLAITVTDVDLAGDFEPTRGTNWEDVRIIREIYPPRVNLSFQVTDADGKVVKEGTRRLVDLAFEMNVPINNTDPLRYEKTLL